MNLELSKRAVGVLRSLHSEGFIEAITKEEVGKMTEGQLLRVPNCGRVTLREIVAWVAKDLRPGSLMGMPTYIRMALVTSGIETIDALISKTEKQLLNLPYIGKKTLKTIKQILAERGLVLAEPGSKPFVNNRCPTCGHVL